ncbi:MAG: hypothetical protein Q4D23_11960 [Bacteroidales bacterium]|nr:hypothetical protein [Bacteroidales bacterium]
MPYYYNFRAYGSTGAKCEGWSGDMNDPLTSEESDFLYNALQKCEGDGDKALGMLEEKFPEVSDRLYESAYSAACIDEDDEEWYAGYTIDVEEIDDEKE